MKPFSKNHFLQTGVSALAVTLLAGCGTPSNKNLGNYTNLKKQMGPVHNAPAPVQTYIPANLFVLEVDRNSSTHFVVGQRSVIRFRTGVNLPGTKYRLVSRDLPRGAEPLKDLGNGLWEFAWTPSQELLPQNAIEPIRGGFHVALDIYEVTNPQSRAIVAGLATERTVDYTLMRSGAIPEITEVAGVAPYPQLTKLVEGDILNLTFTVKDTTASPSQKPRLVTLALANRITQEQSKISGHGFLFIDSDPVMVKPGVWQFKAFFDTKNNPVPEFNVDGQNILQPALLVDLAIQILSPNRTVSPVKTYSFEITYRRELLKPAFKANPELQIVSQNSLWTYDFESYLPSPVGTMTVYLADETIKLPGSPKMRCKLSKKSNQHQNCRIEWKIPCAVPTGELVIKAVAAAEYQGQTTSLELLKKLTINEAKKCVEPKAATGAPDATPANGNSESGKSGTSNYSGTATKKEAKALKTKKKSTPVKKKKSSGTKISTPKPKPVSGSAVVAKTVASSSSTGGSQTSTILSAGGAQ